MTHTPQLHKPRSQTCLACGARIERSLALGGSLRCHDCRDSRAPLRWDLVEGRRGGEPHELAKAA